MVAIPAIHTIGIEMLIQDTIEITTQGRGTYKITDKVARIVKICAMHRVA